MAEKKIITLKMWTTEFITGSARRVSNTYFSFVQNICPRCGEGGRCEEDD